MIANPLWHCWRRIGNICAGLVPVRLPARGTPDDMERVIDDLQFIDTTFETLIAAYRDEVSSSFPYVDKDVFQQAIDVMKDTMSDLRGHLKDVASDLAMEEEDAA